MKKRFVDRQIKNRYLIYIILCSFFLGSFLGVLVHPGSAAFGVFDSIDDLLISGTSVGANRMIALGASNNVAVVGLTSSGKAFISTYGISSSGDIGSSFLDNWTLDYSASSYSYVGVCHVYGDIYLVARVVSTSVRLVTVSVSASGVITKSIVSGRNFTATNTGGTDMELLSMESNHKYIVSFTGSMSGKGLRGWCWSVSDAGTISATSDSDISFGSDSTSNMLFLIDSNSFGCAFTQGAGNSVGVVSTFNVSGAGVMTASDTWTFVSPVAGISGINPFVSHVNGTIYSIAYYDAAGPTKNYLKTFRISVIGVITKSFLNSNSFSTSSAASYPSSLVYNGSVNHTILLSYGEASGCIVKAFNVSSSGTIFYVSNYGYWSSNQNKRAVIIRNPLFYVISYVSVTAPGFRLNTFTLDGTEESGGSTSTVICGYDVSAFDDEKSLPYTNPSYTRSSLGNGYQVIETYYGIPSTTVVLGVSLLISASQYSFSGSVANYDLKINGVEIGAPLCIDQYGREDTYRVFWSCSEAVSGSGVLFEFKNSVPYFPGGPYWVSLPVDTIASGGWNYGKYSSGFFNGVYDGNSFVLGVSTPLEFQMTFWCSSFIFENITSPYNDLVTCPKTIYDTFDTIPLFYFISDFTYANTIQLWRNGSQLTSQKFPLAVQTGDFNGESSYTSFHSGKYQFRLIRNTFVKSTFNVTVTDPVDMNFVLAVYPNPCEFNTLVSIGYRFYPVDGADGFIGVSEFADTGNYSDFEHAWSISANVSGNYTFYPQTNMYVSLWKKTGSSYILMKIKYLKMLSLFDNTINVGYKSIQLSDAVPSVSQRIYGTQVVQGFNTFVRMNSKILQYVTDTPFYNVYVDMSKSGNYNVELCMETANGSKVLCSVNFTVSPPSTGGDAAETFPPEMKLLFGICCILVAVSCPLMISVKYHVAVPTFVYVVFMAFGIGIGTVLGFLELWLVFLFVVALVAGAVFTIFGHGGSGGGGGGGDSGTIRKGGILSRRGGKDYAGASRKADYGVSPKGSPGYLKGPGRRGY